LIYEFAVGDVLDHGSLFITDGLDINTSETLSFDIAANQNFYVVSSISTYSKNGYSDAWNTLSMTFDNNSNLQAAIGNSAPVLAVPEPQTFLLFFLALVLMTFRAKKVWR